jgi:hypothetical protein
MTLLLHPPPPGEAGLYALAGRPQGLRQLMLAGGRAPAGEAGPTRVHQGDEIPRVLSGQILIRYRDRRRTARLVRRSPLPGNPNVPIWTAAASRQAGVMPAQSITRLGHSRSETEDTLRYVRWLR